MGNLNVRLQVLVSKSLRSRIRSAASRRQVSDGEWIRRILEQALEEEPNDQTPLAQLSSLDAPTGDVDQMLEEIEAGRL